MNVILKNHPWCKVIRCLNIHCSNLLYVVVEFTRWCRHSGVMLSKFSSASQIYSKDGLQPKSLKSVHLIILCSSTSFCVFLKHKLRTFFFLPYPHSPKKSRFQVYINSVPSASVYSRDLLLNYFSHSNSRSLGMLTVCEFPKWSPFFLQGKRRELSSRFVAAGL